MHSKLAKAVGALVSASFMVSMIPAMATAAIAYETRDIDFSFTTDEPVKPGYVLYVQGINLTVSGGANSQVNGSGNRYFGVDGNIGGEETGAGTGIYTFSIAPDDIYEGCNIVGIEIEAYNFTGCQLVGDDWTYDEDERILAWEGDAPSVSLELAALSDNDNHYFNYDSITVSVEVPVSEEVFRLFNEDTGEHLYTADEGEIACLEDAGWSNEGPCWVAPYATGTAVYRLFNESDGEHLYIADQGEISYLVDQGWKNEGVAFFSYDGEGGTPVYRVFDPNGLAFTHTYSIDEGEVAYLVDNGWRNEGEAFYGLPELQEAVATPEEAPVAEAPVLYE